MFIYQFSHSNKVHSTQIPLPLQFFPTLRLSPAATITFYSKFENIRSVYTSKLQLLTHRVRIKMSLFPFPLGTSLCTRLYN